MNVSADPNSLPGKPVDDRPGWATSGTVGVTTTGPDSDTALREIQQETMKYLEVSGIPTSALAPKQMGSGATGVFFWLAATFIVDHVTEIVVAAGISEATKRLLKERKRRELEARNERLPIVMVDLEDARGKTADILHLVAILEGLESKLTERHPNRRYIFDVVSRTKVVPFVEVNVKASDLTHSVHKAISKLTLRYEGADRITLRVKRNPFGKAIVEAEVAPPVPPFENPHWNGTSIL